MANRCAGTRAQIAKRAQNGLQKLAKTKNNSQKYL